MICYSVVARRLVQYVASPHGMGVAVPYVQNPYPRPKEGIVARLDGDRYVVPVGDNKSLFVDARLARNADFAVPEGDNIRILNASIVLADCGDFKLTLPREDEDYQSILVLLDVSRGRSGRVVYRHSNGFGLFVRGYQNRELFVGEEEVILATLSAGENIVAERLDKRFIWFGRERSTEEIHFSYNHAFHATLTTSGSDQLTRIF